MADIDNQNNGGSPAGGDPSNQANNEENNNNENSLDKQISDIINKKLLEFQNQIAGTITTLQENAKT